MITDTLITDYYFSTAGEHGARGRAPGLLRSGVLGLLFLLTQVLEFLQLFRRQNRSQFIQFLAQVIALGSGERRSTSAPSTSTAMTAPTATSSS
jgi:hypothetical protein